MWETYSYGGGKRQKKIPFTSLSLSLLIYEVERGVGLGEDLMKEPTLCLLRQAA